MAYGNMYRTNRSDWGYGSAYGGSRSGNFFNNRVARGGVGYGREFEGYRGTRDLGYRGTSDIGYGREFSRTGYPTDLGYGGEYRGGAAYYKSDYETDFGDPFGDRERGTPIRMMRGDWDESFGYGREFNRGYGRTFRGSERNVDLNYGRDFTSGYGSTYWGRRPTGWRY